MRFRVIHLRLGGLTLAVLMGMFATAALVWAFAEEPLGWRDPATGLTYSQPQINTIHDDLTYVLALAAGFSISDAEKLQTWDQLVDSELLPGAVVSYTNGGGGFYPQPDPSAACAGIILPHNTLVWPHWVSMTVTNSVTSRFGPLSPFFHFPHRTGPLAQRDIGALHDWAWGLTNTLTAYEAYAWGGPADQTVMHANCFYTRTVAVTTTIAAGSLEAFATYLHSVGDSYSHEECIAKMDALGMPWATHTIPPYDQSVPECDYHPSTPTDSDVHGQEYYTYTASARTDAAIRAIYAELVARSVQREGQYYPLTLDTPISGTQTLSDTLAVFAHAWTFNQAAERRNYLDQLAPHILAARQPTQYLYLPLIIR